jgi:hypothetical protein
VDTRLDARIRFVLGHICLDIIGDDRCAEYHWYSLLTQYQDTPEAKGVRRLLSRSWSLSEKLQSGYSDDWTSNNELEISRSLWEFTPPPLSYKLDRSEGIDLAVRYLNEMLQVYDGEWQQAIILYDKFMMWAGFSTAGVGYWPYGGSENLDTCQAISEELRELSREHYVQTQFLLGLMTSGTLDVKLNLDLKEKSIKFFENILEMTEDDQGSFYRFLARIWLIRYYDKHNIDHDISLR